MSAHGRNRGRFPRRTRTVPPHVCEAKAQRKAARLEQLQFPLAAFGGGICCYCEVDLSGGGFIWTFDGRMRCKSLSCGAAERREKAKVGKAGEGEAA